MKKIMKPTPGLPKGVIAGDVHATSFHGKSWDKKDALEEQVKYLKGHGMKGNLTATYKPKGKEKQLLALAGHMMFDSRPSRPDYNKIHTLMAKLKAEKAKGKRK